MKRFTALLLLLVLLTSMVTLTSCGEHEVTHTARIEIINYGTIVVDLYGKEAPKTVENFVNLAKSGFYNGLTFHRVINGFMMQGGDPLANGTGGSEKTIEGEFAYNGFRKNKIKHERGVISMARSQGFNSASCQFFIMHKDNSELDKRYAAFGKVREGMDIVDKICTGVKAEDDNGTVAKNNQPIIKQITIDGVAGAKAYEEKATHKAILEIKDHGTIVLELYGDIAPITVSNFEKLANEGFYDGLTFHRILKTFMMQGGDPKGDGTGDSGKDIKGEFSSNGVKNNISHVRGVISMARSNPYDSGSCQFFIVHKDSFHLDGEYAAFGRVISGIEVVDSVCENVRVGDGGKPLIEEETPVIVSLRVEKLN